MRVCSTAACLLLVACAPSETAPSPILGSVTPERGPAGAVVTLQASRTAQGIVVRNVATGRQVATTPDPYGKGFFVGPIASLL